MKLPPVITGLLTGGAMWAVARATPGLRLPLPASRLLVAGFLALAGLAIAGIAVASFRRVRTTVNPLQPEAASSLVVSGIYRRSRNPMYLGLLLVLLGWAVYLANVLALVFPIAYVPLMNLLQIIPEEKALAARFGAAFEAYRAGVRRWL